LQALAHPKTGLEGFEITQPSLELGGTSVDISHLTNAQNLGKSILSKATGKVLIAITAMIFSISALAQNPIPMVTAPLVPGQKNPASPAFTLTVNGNGFVSGATVNWNGNARTTTFFSSKQLTASINAADVATASTTSVTVVNPAPGGGRSNVVYFQVVKTATTAGFAKLDYSTDASPQDVTTADFNGDGKLDLAVPTGNNTISILRGRYGRFQQRWENRPRHCCWISESGFRSAGQWRRHLPSPCRICDRFSSFLGRCCRREWRWQT
jgi:hypothetical protein